MSAVRVCSADKARTTPDMLLFFLGGLDVLVVDWSANEAHRRHRGTPEGAPGRYVCHELRDTCW